MKTVYKYPLQMEGDQEVAMPGKPVLFKVGLDPVGALCVWALVEPQHELKPQRFFIVGTGHPAPDDGRYLGSASLHGGNLIFHVFEKAPL